MSSALPVLIGRKVVRVFETFGWQVVRQVVVDASAVLALLNL